ncbi:MAG: aldehyde dehydrogenase family protein, partial [Miltoncostaeaceae bacterium]
MAALTLDARLALARSSAEELERVGPQVIDSAVAEIEQPRRFAERELRTALDFARALPSLAEPLRSRPAPAVSGRTDIEWRPFGVALGWHAANAPTWVPALVTLSGLVAGNAVISRPSARARLTSRAVVEALARPWPDDAVRVADLDATEALPLLWHDLVHVVVAHGSTETCRRHVAALGRAYLDGARMRPYIPEASGNDALLVLDGADLDRAAEAAAVGGFANGGQLCMAAKRIIVERSVWQSFRPRLIEAVSALRVGPAADPATDVVPLRAGRGFQRAVAALDAALAAGGVPVVGEGIRDGALTPTVVELPDSALETPLWVEESFAPLRGLTVVADQSRAVELANASRYGLGAAVFGGEASVAERLDAARVVVGEGPLYSDPHLVVGGVR